MEELKERRLTAAEVEELEARQREYRTEVIGLLTAEDTKYILRDGAGKPVGHFSAYSVDPATIGYEVVVHRNAAGKVMSCGIRKPGKSGKPS